MPAPPPSASQWLFSPSHLSSTPSSTSGIPLPKELHQRRQAIIMITGIMMRLMEINPIRKVREEAMTGHYRVVDREFKTLPTAKDVVSTAAIFLHRFYMRHSLRAYQYNEIAPACLCLALKVEERTNIKIHYVARATKAKLDINNDYDEAYYITQIAQNEDVLLETICFDLVVGQPLGGVLMGIKEICSIVSREGGGKGLIARYGSGKLGVAGFGNGITGGAGASPLVRSSSLNISQSGPFPLASDGGRSTSSSGGRTPYKGGGGGGGDLKSADERSDRAVLEMAYLICYESTTTPLCLLYLTNQIASACLIVALSILSKRHYDDIIRSIDGAWMKAFDDGLGLEGEKGLEEFKRVMGDAVDSLLKYAKEGLMMTDGFGKKPIVDVKRKPVEEAQMPVPSPAIRPDIATPTGSATPDSAAVTPTPFSGTGSAGMDIEEGELVEEEAKPSPLGDGYVAMKGVHSSSSNSRPLAVPSEGSLLRPKTSDTLRSDIEGCTTASVPITKQVGRDVADVTSELLVADARRGIAVDELGMSAELSTEDAVMKDAE